MSDTTLLTIGIILIFLGFVIAVSAIILTIIRQPTKRKEVRGGAVIFIGPIPIIFGTDKRMAGVAVILALLIIIAILVLYFIS